MHNEPLIFTNTDVPLTVVGATVEYAGLYHRPDSVVKKPDCDVNNTCQPPGLGSRASKP